MNDTRTSAPVDDWGFTESDHAELRTLMHKHESTLPSIFAGIARNEGIEPMRDDPGFMGLLAAEKHLDIRTRVFPKGGLWRSLLEHLRELDTTTSTS